MFVNYCWYLDIVTLFRGSLKHKRANLGCRIALSTFDNDYLLGNTYLHSIAAYVNMRTRETCVLILVEYLLNNRQPSGLQFCFFLPSGFP